MIDEIFNGLESSFVPGAVRKPMSFYFSLADYKKTVEINMERCLVSDGKTIENAACVCKTGPEFFLKIWNDGYRPGMKDFMTGTIKSNNPTALQEFLRAFGKEA